VARTYFVDPSKQQEAEYAALQEAQAAAVAALVEGAPMSAAYEAVVATLKVGSASSELFWFAMRHLHRVLRLLGCWLSVDACSLLQDKGQEALVDKLSRNVGTAIGLELRDTTQQLNANNPKPVKAGMTFNVAVGETEVATASLSWPLVLGQCLLVKGVISAFLCTPVRCFASCGPRAQSAAELAAEVCMGRCVHVPSLQACLG
jgi:Xaa-Pro aminopeptidase